MAMLFLRDRGRLETPQLESGSRLAWNVARIKHTFNHDVRRSSDTHNKGATMRKVSWPVNCTSVLLIGALLAWSGVAAAQVSVVNMVPTSNSGETNRDAEPNLAIDTASPLMLAASAFT